MSRNYRHSEELLDRALKSIPLASQTFSKSLTQYPRGAAPFFITRGKGSKAWDADGNEYVDFVNGLLAVSLGYGDPDVDAAVKAQMENGVIFSLPHPIEMETAEKICEMVPCAEKVRFGKNGSDATAGAVRAARAFTGRERIAVGGYHGWQDWYIGSTTRNKGVPEATRGLTHPFPYNDLEALHGLFKEHPDQFAAVILEPMNITEPEAGYLEGIQELARKNGALLIFDEMITGFRFAKGGAQELFGVTPDLASFGKGLANGYPLAAVAGRADVMREMEEVFFSFTMGGETLSLAAAKAVMEKLEREPVIETIARQGAKVKTGIQALIDKHGAGDILSVSGHPSWTFLVIADHPDYDAWALKTLYLQEIFARGVLSLTTHNMSYAHDDDDVKTLLNVYDQVFPLLQEAIANRDLDDRLRCQRLEPLFKVR